jgi:hypothetical protein
VDARGDDGLLRKDPLAGESGQRPESGRRRTCRLGLHMAAQQGTRGARAQQGMREARALALYSHAGPGVRSAHAEAKDLAAAAQACWPWPLARWASRGPGGLRRAGSGLRVRPRTDRRIFFFFSRIHFLTQR